jgi:hypothetical protein
MNEAPPAAGIPPEIQPAYKDRRTGLILFGTLQVFLGILCLLAVGLMVFGQLMMARTTRTPTNLAMLIPGLVFYIALAVAFIWLGVGSMQCRRWGRALTLILAWMWLAIGGITVPLMVWLMPKILASAPTRGQKLPPEVITTILVIQIAFMAVFFILLPGCLVLFYRSRHVKDTCDARDPVPRWTDASPLPVLAVTCLTTLGAVMMLVMPLTKLAMFPFFGSLLTGIPAAILMIVMALVFLWIGQCWYRLKVAGWWALVAIVIVFGISNLITFSRLSLVEIYQKLEYPQEQIDLIQQQGWADSGFMMWSAAVWLVPMLGYLFWTKRYFR